MNVLKKKLHDLEYQQSIIKSDIKKTRADLERATIEEYVKTLMDVKKERNLDQYTLTIFLNELVSQIKDIQDRS